MTPALPLDLLQHENTIKTCLICSYMIVLINKPVGRTVTALRVLLGHHAAASSQELRAAAAAARATVASC